MSKIEELVDRSKGRIRVGVAREKITAMGYRGSERSTWRAVAEVKEAWRAGRRRRYRSWVPEPGMWLQWDWGDGLQIRGRKTQLFSAWLAWSRFRVVIPAWDQQLGAAAAQRAAAHLLMDSCGGAAAGGGPSRASMKSLTMATSGMLMTSPRATRHRRPWGMSRTGTCGGALLMRRGGGAVQLQGGLPSGPAG
jgi:hypothetical protein